MNNKKKKKSDILAFCHSKVLLLYRVNANTTQSFWVNRMKGLMRVSAKKDVYKCSSLIDIAVKLFNHTKRLKNTINQHQRWYITLGCAYRLWQLLHTSSQPPELNSHVIRHRMFSGHHQCRTPLNEETGWCQLLKQIVCIWSKLA